jgi:T-complex protein 1 subunit eta
MWFGVDIDDDDICDTMERGVWEPVASKINSFSSATEAACLILSIDETIRNPQSQTEDGGAAAGMGRGGRGIGRGAPMSAAMGGGGMKGMMGGGGGRGIRAYQGKGGR